MIGSGFDKCFLRKDLYDDKRKITRRRGLLAEKRN